MRFRLIPLLLFTFILFSCRKNEGFKTPLVGNWELSETFDGYANGGKFIWQPVPASAITKLSFSATNGYTSDCPANNKTCIGTYLLKGSNAIEISSNCNYEALTYTITELTSKSLILDYQVREGVIREKYVK